MSDYVVPCEHPDNDAEDWFIEKDGKQYIDDVLVSPEDFEETWEFQEATDAAVRQALTRRRHARDKCFTECYFRTQCLSIALGDLHPTYGTWGGYFPEQLKQIRTLRDKRAQERPVD